MSDPKNIGQGFEHIEDPRDAVPPINSPEALPSGAEPTNQARNPVLASAPAVKPKGSVDGGRPSFASKTATSEGSRESSCGADWTSGPTNVRTRQQAEELIDKIKLLPAEQRPDSLVALIECIPSMESDSGLAVLGWVCQETVALVAAGVDCGALYSCAPRSAKSLGFDGYMAVRGMVRSVSIRDKVRKNHDTYGEYLAGLSDLLIQSSDNKQTRSDKRFRDLVNAEVTFLFDGLEKVPPRHRMKALQLLGEKRYLLPRGAAETVTRGVLHALLGVELTTDQRTVIARALPRGLREIPRSENTRFIDEFYRLARTDLGRERAVRLEMLLGLAEYLGLYRFPPLAEESMKDIVRTNGFSWGIAVIEQHRDPFARARLIADLARNFYLMSKDEYGRSLVDDRLSEYHRQLERLLQADKQAAIAAGGEYEKAYELAATQMLAARKVLKPSEPEESG